MKGALALLITGGTENWAPGRWRERFTRVCPERRVALIPDDAIDPVLVRYAAVWKPKPGALRQFPKLEVIFNLGAGVDAVVADATLPDVPLVRVAVDDLTRRMTEYVVMHVLMHHRRQGYYTGSQHNRVWAPKLQWAARDLRVGVMGLGVLGRDAADVLARIGFDVAGWSNTPKAIAGIKCFAGQAQLAKFLARTDLLVCLLPLTPQTRGFLNAALFAKLPRGAHLINVGRGDHLVEADLLPALNAGQLSAATLDALSQEPLPAGHPFWGDPRILITPHIATRTDRLVIAQQTLANLALLQRGQRPPHQVDLERGY